MALRRILMAVVGAAAFSCQPAAAFSCQPAAVTILGISAAVGTQTIDPNTYAPDGTVVQVTGLPQTQ